MFRTSKLAGVPAAQLVQTTLYELIEHAPADEDEDEADGEEAALAPERPRKLFRR